MKHSRLSNKEYAAIVVENHEPERFAYYLQRIIRGSLSHMVFKGGDVADPEELGINLLFTRAFLEVANCAKEIMDLVQTLEQSPHGFENLVAINEMKEFIFQTYHSSILSLFKRDVRAAEKTLEMAKKFQLVEANVRENFGKNSVLDSSQAFALAGLLVSLKKVNELSSEIAGLVLELLQEKFVQESEKDTKQVVPLLASIPKDN